MSSSNGNVSETFEQTENFNSSEDWGQLENPSSEDEYDPRFGIICKNDTKSKNASCNCTVE